MVPSRSFSKLLKMGLGRLFRLKYYASVGLKYNISEKDRHFSYVIIEAQNLWSNFSRSYLLSCLLRPKRISKGFVILSNAAITTPGDLLLLATRIHRGRTAAAPTTRREEPPWHDRNIFLRTCNELGCSHYSDILSAMSIQTRVLEDIPVFRNFYAHRNEESTRKAIDLGRHKYLITGASHPTEVLATPPYKRTQPLILDWLDDIQVTIEFLCD